MTDQIVFFQRKDHVKEKSQHVLSVSFRDRATAALVVPTNIYYRLDNLATGAVILDWTSVSADDEIDITVTPTQNTLYDQCASWEVRQVTVSADYGLATAFVDSVTYRLENVQGVS